MREWLSIARRGLVVCALCVSAPLASVGPALAHKAGVSTSRITLEGREVRAEINSLARDYEKAVGVRIAEGISGEVNPIALAVNAQAIQGYAEAHVAVLAGRQPCPLAQRRLLAVGTHVVVRLAWRCPDDGSVLAYRVTLFQDVDPSARHLALIKGPNGEHELVAQKDAPEVLLEGGEASFLQVVVRFLLAGIDHIFLGYDHVAFLIAVILWGRRLWPLVKVVTAFTIAHSITLSLAVFEVVTPPSWIIEPLIAASIAFVAAENFFVRDIAKRWRITFAFGLIHGFGFAAALREFGLPQDALIPALAFFNIGVEVGQAAIVSLAVPLLLVVDRALSREPVRQRNTAFVYSCSAVILGLGLYWLAKRTVLAGVL